LQTIRCRQLAATEAGLGELLAALGPTVEEQRTLRCCAVLEGPPVAGEQQTLLAVLPPPTATATAQAQQQQQQQQGVMASGVVRALALCNSTAVCPPGRHLLYLWAAAGPESGGGGEHAAAQALLPVLAALADVDPGEVLRGGAGDTQAPAGESTDAQLAAGGNVTDTHRADGVAAGGAGTPTVRPAVLWASFYTQSSRRLAAGGGGRWPANVALCPGPDSTATFSSAVEAAQECYWRLYADKHSSRPPFPLVPKARRAAAAKEQGDAAAAGEPGAVAAAAGSDSDDEVVAALQQVMGRMGLQPEGSAEGSAD
jgi:hypothetical protein